MNMIMIYDYVTVSSSFGGGFKTAPVCQNKNKAFNVSKWPP